MRRGRGPLHREENHVVVRVEVQDLVCRRGWEGEADVVKAERSLPCLGVDPEQRTQGRGVVARDTRHGEHVGPRAHHLAPIVLLVVIPRFGRVNSPGVGQAKFVDGGVDVYSDHAVLAEANLPDLQAQFGGQAREWCPGGIVGSRGRREPGEIQIIEETRCPILRHRGICTQYWAAVTLSRKGRYVLVCGQSRSCELSSTSRAGLWMKRWGGAGRGTSSPHACDN